MIASDVALSYSPGPGSHAQLLVPLASCVKVALAFTRQTGAAMKESSRSVQDLVRRIRGEFMEMPGLRLTVQQARRLWRLDETVCDMVLSTLVDSHFLAITPDGMFVRQDGRSH